MKDKSVNRQGKIIAVMAVVILLLGGFVLYMFAVKPAISGYVIGKQIEAQNLVVSALVSQIQQTGYVQIPVGEEVLVLVPYQKPEEQLLEQSQELLNE